jgi:hypothetical protein
MPSQSLPSSAKPAMVSVSRWAQGERKHLLAVDLETFAELDVAAVDDLLQMLLALDQRQLSKVIAVEIEQVEGDQHYPCRLSFQLVLKD